VTSVLLAVATVRLRTVHRVALAASGFDVYDVERPDEIANRLARSGIEAMVIDVTRAFGGSALLHQLSRDADLPAGVLALTPVNDPTVVLAALAAGADDYLPISAGSERVVAAVRRIAGGPRPHVSSARVTIGGASDER
jgi:DNA-binding NarL/FixJ family response regulator